MHRRIALQGRKAPRPFQTLSHTAPFQANIGKALKATLVSGEGCGHGSNGLRVINPLAGALGSDRVSQCSVVSNADTQTRGLLEVERGELGPSVDARVSSTPLAPGTVPDLRHVGLVTRVSSRRRPDPPPLTPRRRVGSNLAKPQMLQRTSNSDFSHRGNSMCSVRHFHDYGDSINCTAGMVRSPPQRKVDCVLALCQIA